MTTAVAFGFTSGARAWAAPALAALRRVTGAALVVALAALALDAVTVGATVSEALRHVAARIYAPFDGYLYGWGPHAESVRQRLLVVDIGQPTLERYRTGWPMSYGQHARLLEQIRRGRPAAVLVDFQFQAERDDPTLPRLLQTLCAFRSDGIPVFLAAGSDVAGGRLRPELENLRDAAGQPCVDKVAVRYEPSAVDGLAWRYPLDAEVGGVRMRSAALAMAEALRGRPVRRDADDSVMGLVWGSGQQVHGPAWQHAAAPAGGAADAPDDASARAYCRPPRWSDHLPLQGLAEKLTQRALDHRPACPMHRSVEAALLTAPKTEAQDAEQRALLQGRAVFYGGSFDPGDFVGSPLHGDLPGVYLHAQATDNLLRFGDDWLRPELGAGGGWLGELASLGGCFFVAAWLLVAARGALRRGLLQVRRRLPSVRRRVDPPRAGGAPVRGALGPIAALRHRLRHDLAATLNRLVLFYLLLLLAAPLGLVLEHLFRVSVIGYGSVLAFCLLGELLQGTSETEDLLAAPKPGGEPA